MAAISWRSKTLLSFISLFMVFVFAADFPWNRFWILLVVMLSTMLMADVLFITPNTFSLDPFYSNWEMRMNSRSH
ncbi:putative integral membrane protein [Babesia bovis T2Bo]|uniref:putative integral membrane protein n=1 Tax=Babesia bovis T2Bo TaxID=484906 RepID=UPI001C358170|nr:putative integral membrane protein [Babesia bovis T2Bo]KAG6439999.1 putative integral membrane protein [Babesia bovis T2Bo]